MIAWLCIPQKSYIPNLLLTVIWYRFRLEPIVGAKIKNEASSQLYTDPTPHAVLRLAT